MKRYALIKGSLVDNVVIANEPVEKIKGYLWICVDDVIPQPGPGWTYENNTFSPPSPPPPLPNVISKLAMIDRFTEVEYEGVLTAAKTDIQVQGWLDRFVSVNQINLDDSRTVSGINLLLSKGLLTQVRVNEILASPVKESERPA